MKIYDCVYKVTHEWSHYNYTLCFENGKLKRINEHSNNTENLTQISEFLGSSYRHLLRVLNKFESEGIIKRDNKKFIVLDKDKLKDLARDFYE